MAKVRVEIDGPDMTVRGTEGVYPDVEDLGDGRVGITDQSGMLRIVNWERRAVEREIYVGDRTDFGGVPVCQILGPLDYSHFNDGGIAVPTRGRYGAFLPWESEEAIRLYSPSGPINSVAFHPMGKYLILGSGFYPLRPRNDLEDETAQVQVWNLHADPPVCEALAAVPGVCVDCLSWAPETGELICASGMARQNQGFLSILEFPSLVARGYIELPGAWNRSVQVFYPEDYRGLLIDEASPIPPAWVLVCDQKRVSTYSIQEGRMKWSYEVDRKLVSAVCDEDELVFVSDGKILDLWNGKRIGVFEELEGTVSLSLGGSCDALWGISNRGALRRWKIQREDEGVV